MALGDGPPKSRSRHRLPTDRAAGQLDQHAVHRRCLAHPGEPLEVRLVECLHHHMRLEVRGVHQTRRQHLIRPQSCSPMNRGGIDGIHPATTHPLRFQGWIRAGVAAYPRGLAPQLDSVDGTHSCNADRHTRFGSCGCAISPVAGGEFAVVASHSGSVSLFEHGTCGIIPDGPQESIGSGFPWVAEGCSGTGTC